MKWREDTRLEGWLKKIDKTRPLAIIMGGSVNGLSFVRSLARRRVPTLLLDSNRLIGTYTRYGKVLLLPPSDTHAQDWLELLEFVGSHLNARGVIFSTSDQYSVFISKYSNILKQHFEFLTLTSDVMELIVNKRLQYETAQSLGIPIPRSYFPESLRDLKHISSDVPYPCILKPYKSHLGRKKISPKSVLVRKVIVIQSQSELISEYERVANDDTPFMIQEIIPGEDNMLFGYLAFWDDKQHELAWLTKRKLRQYPPLYGDGSLQITVEAPEITELSQRLLRAFHYCGFVGIEYKLDARDRTYRLMEINPRTVSGNQLAIKSGCDFPWIGYQYLIGAEIGPIEAFRPGVKYVNEEWDLKTYLALRKSGSLKMKDWLRSLAGTKAWAIGAWDDPLPLVTVLRRFLKASCRDFWSSVRRVTTG